MSEKEQDKEKAITKHFKKILILVIIIAVVVVLAMGFVVFNTTRTETKSRMVDFNLKDIGELATQAGYFTNVQVISSSRELFGITVPFTQSNYVYSYDGVVKAGVNFELVDVSVDEENSIITVKMPEVEILSLEVYEDSLEVYDESKNIFTPLSISSFNQSLTDLKEEVRQRAVDNGLLESAKTNAETLIKGFIAGMLDIKTYTFEFLPLEEDKLAK